MTSREVEHGRDGGGASYGRGADRALTPDEGKDGRGDLGGRADEVELSLRPEGGDVGVPVEVDVHGDEDEVKAAGNFP